MRKFLVSILAATALFTAAPAVVAHGGGKECRSSWGKCLLTGESAEAYIHIDAAQNYCWSWNNQSAVDNIRYVEATLGRAAMPMANAYYPGVRYGNNDVRVTIQWHERSPGSANDLAIDYACRIQGTDDAHMYPVGIAGSAVYWIYH